MSDDGQNRNPDGTFRKGFTANRKGAPTKLKRKRPATAFDVLFDEAFDPVAKDLPPGLGPEHEAAYRTYVAALNGGKQARRKILKHIRRRAEEAIRLESQNGPKPDVKRETEVDNPDTADEALLILGIAREDPLEDTNITDLRLKLLPWAVQAALGRRHGGQQLSSKEIEEIKYGTANPDRIRWPRGYANHVRKSR